LHGHIQREEIIRGTLRYGLLAVLAVVAMVAGAMMASPARAATFVYVVYT